MRKKKIKKIKKTLPGHQIKPTKKVARVLTEISRKKKNLKRNHCNDRNKNMSDAARKKTKIIHRRGYYYKRKYFINDLINPDIKLENVSFSK